MECIAFKKGYKYQLKEAYVVTVPIRPATDLDTDYIALTTQGALTIKQGYAWDGPSGPTVDTLSFMRGSLVHDALYQLMRNRLLNRGQHRETADRVLQSICREDGMNRIRAWWV